MKSVTNVKHSSELKAVRRSVALPRSLVQELSAIAPAELRGNWNRLVIVALQEYAASCRDLTFELQMASMAADPEVQSECQLIAKEFSVADLDGLRRD